MSEFLRRRGLWILAALLFLALLLRYGGTTVVVRNQSFRTICAVQVSRAVDQAEAGPNRLGGPLRYPQSRDIRLPLFWNLFVPAEERRLYALELLLAGRPAQALQQYRLAWEAGDSHRDTILNLARLSAQQRLFGQAAAFWDEAARRTPHGQPIELPGRREE